ncbi:hypothetical protein AAMO2058_000443600 [Amorphochlora amoebiformis]
MVTWSCRLVFLFSQIDSDFQMSCFDLGYWDLSVANGVSMFCFISCYRIKALQDINKLCVLQVLRPGLGVRKLTAMESEVPS